MNWLRKWMTGRYGTDQLTLFLLALSVLISLVVQLLHLPLLLLLGYVPLGIGLYRTMSKDISKRSMENYRFSMWISPVYSWSLRTRDYLRDRKTHRYYKCPRCGTHLRVPKGKGKIQITCPKCEYEFIKKT